VFGRRSDATLVRNVSTVRRFMPFVSPTRNGSLVYFASEIRLEAAFAYLERRNAQRPPERAITLFHLLLHAIARSLHERPRINRFTAGGRLWQRDGVWISFAAKRQFDDDAPLLTVKRRFAPGEAVDDVADDLLARLDSARGGRRSAADREMALALHLPSPLIREITGLLRGADALGLLPRAMIENDPLFTSAFVANLGSIGLEAGYHHLWEWGTCPLFCVLGHVRTGADGGRIATLKWTFDERVEDGLYAGRSADRVRELVESPEKL
jgi:hypothetical protein